MTAEQRTRGTKPYLKPALTHSQLTDQFRSRGLVIPDESRAERYLRHIGYYRLSPYTIPFQLDRGKHQFRAGTTFNAILDLYVFDRALRLLVMDALERIEVAIRASLTDHMSLNNGGPHWYMDPAHFKDPHRHDGLLTIVRTTCSDQLEKTPETDETPLIHRSALEHYLTTYGSPELPPSWPWSRH